MIFFNSYSFLIKRNGKLFKWNCERKNSQGLKRTSRKTKRHREKPTDKERHNHKNKKDKKIKNENREEGKKHRKMGLNDV